MTIRHMGHGGFILGQTCWEEFNPWLRPAASDWLAEHLPPGARVFEWGAGASTVWLARRGYSVVTCELDGEWCDLVRRELNVQGLDSHARVIHFPAQDSQEKRLQDYADFICHQALDTFDLVLVDGRNRNRCLGNCRPHVKRGGFVCLDNSERSEYNAGMALFTAWAGLEWGDDGWGTIIWTRPDEPVGRVVLDNADA